MSVVNLSMVFLAFVLGLRHGVDWDHIAAIMDLVGREKRKKRGLVLAIWYAIGHEFVIVSLGAAAVSFGWMLPEWVDGFMEKLVGVTLIILSVLLLNYLFRNDPDMILVSRWRIVYMGITNFVSWLGWKISGKYRQYDSSLNIGMSSKSAFMIGVIHGIGAETPSQFLLFVAAAGAGTTGEGLLVVTSFVAGLLISHMTIVIVCLFGFNRVVRRPVIYRSFGIVTSVYSLVLGIMFVSGEGSLLPAIF